MIYFIAIFTTIVTSIVLLTLVYGRDFMRPIANKCRPYISGSLMLYIPYTLIRFHLENLGFIMAVYNCYYFYTNKDMDRRISIIAFIVNIVYYIYKFIEFAGYTP